MSPTHDRPNVDAVCAELIRGELSPAACVALRVLLGAVEHAAKLTESERTDAFAHGVLIGVLDTYRREFVTLPE